MAFERLVILGQDFDARGADAIMLVLETIVSPSDIPVHHMLLSRSFFTNTRSCSKSPDFPVAEVSFLNRHASCYPPAEFRLVHKSNVDIQEAFLELVLDPLHDFAS
jgi:hypothetical protein